MALPYSLSATRVSYARNSFVIFNGRVPSDRLSSSSSSRRFSITVFTVGTASGIISIDVGGGTNDFSDELEAAYMEVRQGTKVLFDWGVLSSRDTNDPYQVTTLTRKQALDIISAGADAGSKIQLYFYDPAAGFGAFNGRKSAGGAFGGRKLSGGAFNGRKFTI